MKRRWKMLELKVMCSVHFVRSCEKKSAKRDYE